MYQFYKNPTASFNFVADQDEATKKITLNGINSTVTSADTICDGVASLMAIGGNRPYFYDANRTAKETVV